MYMIAQSFSGFKFWVLVMVKFNAVVLDYDSVSSDA
jgi:hypothetical protein